MLRQTALFGTSPGDAFIISSARISPFSLSKQTNATRNCSFLCRYSLPNLQPTANVPSTSRQESRPVDTPRFYSFCASSHLVFRFKTTTRYSPNSTPSARYVLLCWTNRIYDISLLSPYSNQLYLYTPALLTFLNRACPVTNTTCYNISLPNILPHSSSPSSESLYVFTAISNIPPRFPVASPTTVGHLGTGNKTCFLARRNKPLRTALYFVRLSLIIFLRLLDSIFI